MKKNLITILLVLFSEMAVSQKCKFVIDKVDDFTKDRFVLCGADKIVEDRGIVDIPTAGGLGVYRLLLVKTSKFITKLNLEYSDSSYYLRFNIYQKNTDLANFISGIYLLVNDSLKSVIPFLNAANDYYNDKNDTEELIIAYKLTDSIISILKNTPLKKIRIQGRGMKQIDYEIKNSQCLIDQFKCLASLNLPLRKKITKLD